MSVVCLLSVCPSLREDIPRSTRDLYQFLCMLPMSVARSSSGTLTIGRIAYRREWGDGSAQRGRSVVTIALFGLSFAGPCTLLSRPTSDYLTRQTCFGPTSWRRRCSVARSVVFSAFYPLPFSFSQPSLRCFVNYPTVYS